MGDCVSPTSVAYDAFFPDGRKYEVRGNLPNTIDTFANAAIQSDVLFFVFLRDGQKKNACASLARPAVFANKCAMSPFTLPHQLVGSHDVSVCP